MSCFVDIMMYSSTFPVILLVLLRSSTMKRWRPTITRPRMWHTWQLRANKTLRWKWRRRKWDQVVAVWVGTDCSGVNIMDQRLKSLSKNHHRFVMEKLLIMLTYPPGDNGFESHITLGSSKPFPSPVCCCGCVLSSINQCLMSDDKDGSRSITCGTLQCVCRYINVLPRELSKCCGASVC